MMVLFWAAPFVAISILLSGLFVLTPQLSEYYGIMIASEQNAWTMRLGMQVATNLLAYSMFCFVIARSLFVALPPMEKLGRRTRILVLLLSLLILHLPGLSIAIILNLRARPTLDNPFGISSILLLGMVFILSVPALLHATKLREARLISRLVVAAARPGRAADAMTALGAVMVAVAYAIYAVTPVSAVQFFGLIATIFIALSGLALVAYAGMRLKRIGVPVATILACIGVASHGLTVTGRIPDQISQLPVAISDGTYEAAKSPMTLFDNHAPILKERSIQELEAAFDEWIKSRQGFAEYTKTRRTRYPIVIVAAQGGGYYAAYHSALFLARLQDRCPRLRSHLFAISGVSGGSLGGAVFTELTRADSRVEYPTGSDMCAGAEKALGQYESAVARFFDFDFLSPVAASAVLFALPRLAVPHLAVGPTRSVALQRAFETSWRRLELAGRRAEGFDRPFYGSWHPRLDSPALFLNSTSVTGGIAAVFSELYMTSLPGRVRGQTGSVMADALFDILRARMDRGVEAALAKVVGAQSDEGQLSERRALSIEILSAYRKQEEPAAPFINVLDFRPDLQIPLSAAVTASASFPFVTAPAVIDRSERVAPRGEKLVPLQQLQLVDGGFADNSGLQTAREITNRIVGFAQRSQLESKIEVHIIAFVHHKSAFLGAAPQPNYPELLTPLATFEAIRLARGRSLTADAPAVREGVPVSVHAIQLFDRAFQAPLSWALSKDTRQGIELRSGGDDGSVPAERQVCCLYDPITQSMLEMPLIGGAMTDKMRAALVKSFGFEFYLRRSEEQSAVEALEKIMAKRFVPNAAAFAGLVDLLSKGGLPVADEPPKPKPADSK